MAKASPWEGSIPKGKELDYLCMEYDEFMNEDLEYDYDIVKKMVSGVKNPDGSIFYKCQKKIQYLEASLIQHNISPVALVVMRSFSRLSRSAKHRKKRLKLTAISRAPYQTRSRYSSIINLLLLR